MGKDGQRQIVVSLVLAVATTAALLPRSARAHFDLDGIWVMTGAEAAGIVGDSPSGTLGLEISLVRSDELVWLGVVADGHWDVDSSQAWASFGPEAGLGPFGLEVAYLVRDDGRRDHGFQVTGVFTTGVVGFGVRGDQLLSSVQEFRLLLSVYLKVPLLFWEGYSSEPAHSSKLPATTWEMSSGLQTVQPSANGSR